MTRKELFRISKQYADLMYQKEYSNLLGKQNRERRFRNSEIQAKTRKRYSCD